MRDYFDWRKDGSCRDSDPRIFSRKSNSYATYVAKKICADCPVKMDCLRHSIIYDEVGTWGGYSDAERNEMVTKNPNGRAQLASYERQLGIFHPEIVRTPIP